MTRMTTRLVIAVALALTLGIAPAHSSSLEARQRSNVAEVALLNALPGPDGATVDVYADEARIARAVGSGALASLRMKPGLYDFAVVPSGSNPRTTQPLATLAGAQIDALTNNTLTLHLSSSGKPTASLFENKTRTVGRDMGRLTVRHVADAPEVDVRSRGRAMLTDIAPGDEAELGLRSGDYRIRIVREGSRKQLIPVSTHSMENEPGRQDMGDNRIIYLWGSAADGTLQIAVQEIPLDLN